MDTCKSKMHKPHPRPLRKDTCMHLAVDSSTSRIAHQQPHSVPSLSHIGPSGHNGSLVSLNSASASQTLHISQRVQCPSHTLLVPSRNSRSKASHHGCPRRTCWFLTALMKLQRICTVLSSATIRTTAFSPLREGTAPHDVRRPL